MLYRTEVIAYSDNAIPQRVGVVRKVAVQPVHLRGDGSGQYIMPCCELFQAAVEPVRTAGKPGVQQGDLVLDLRKQLVRWDDGRFQTAHTLLQFFQSEQ